MRREALVVVFFFYKFSKGFYVCIRLIVSISIFIRSSSLSRLLLFRLLLYLLLALCIPEHDQSNGKCSIR